MKIKFKPYYYWITIFAVTSISYQVIIDNIRPNYNGGNSTFSYLLGVAPNFFPGIGIPALFFVLITEISKKNNTNVWLNGKKHITANIISIIGLLSWEFFQITTEKLKFDWNDILWTLIGSLIFHLIWIITPVTLKRI